jgi:hypothetical protein
MRITHPIHLIAHIQQYTYSFTYRFAKYKKEELVGQPVAEHTLAFQEVVGTLGQDGAFLSRPGRIDEECYIGQYHRSEAAAVHFQ